MKTDKGQFDAVLSRDASKAATEPNVLRAGFAWRSPAFVFFPHASNLSEVIRPALGGFRSALFA